MMGRLKSEHYALGHRIDDPDARFYAGYLVDTPRARLVDPGKNHHSQPTGSLMRDSHFPYLRSDASATLVAVASCVFPSNCVKYYLT